MCLLIFAHRVVDGMPLIVAANRDEFLARPTTPMTVLHPAQPHLRGGRDLEAGGSWMSTADTGLVIALTNQPGGRFPDRHSRGKLPLLLAGIEDGRAADAATAVERVKRLNPSRYNPCWLLIADRERAFYVDMAWSPGQPDAPVVTELEPGIHVLENRPLTPASSKAAHTLEHATDALNSSAIVDALFAVLSSHEAAPAPNEPVRPEALLAPCVHYGPYGTRSASVVTVPDVGPPRLHYTEERPCDAVRNGGISALDVVADA